MFINRAQLTAYERGFSIANEYVGPIQAKAAALNSAEAETTIFLSHSSKDRDLVNPTIAFLRCHGVKLYVDWMDEGMPDVVSGDTAKKLKERIKQQNKFLVLVTENSKDSRWVPWELGYADSAKGMQNIAAFPVVESDHEFKNNEYLQIYPRLEFYSGHWILWTAEPPALVNLDAWLRR